MALRVNGARVLITGATGGLGEAMARALRAEGAELLLTGRKADALRNLALETQATTIVADLGDPEQVTALVQQAGEVDVLINNAAVPAVGTVIDSSRERMDSALDVNLRAPIMLSREFTSHFLERGRGHLVLIGSMAARVASANTALYNATKFGLRGFALAHRQDLRGSGVGVSIIHPGFVSDAGMFADSGMRLPGTVRTVTPHAVAQAVIRSIEKDIGEIVVAPVEQRIQNAVGSFAPSFDAWLQRMFGVGDAFSQHRGGRSEP